MITVDDLIDLARKRIDEHRAEATSVGAIYKFVLDGEGGGTFVVNLTETPSVTPGDGPAQCTINAEASDFVEIIEGRVDSRQFFFEGRLRVDGPMGLAMKLRKLSAAAIRARA